MKAELYRLLLEGVADFKLLDYLLAHPELVQQLCDALDARSFN